MTNWIIATEVYFSDMDGIGGQVTGGDDITINSGGKVHQDQLVQDDGGGVVTVSGITVNAGGIMRIDSSEWIDAGDPVLNITTGTAIIVNEGGQLRSLGTAASRVAVTGEDTGSAGHWIKLNQGGKFYSDYTDISNFIQGIYQEYGGIIEMYNSTISGIGQYGFTSARAGRIYLVNCSIAASGTYTCFYGGYDLIVTAINCAFTSATDNRLATAAQVISASFYGCTYQGNPIAADDITTTTQDIDLRIYEASVVPVIDGSAAVLAGATLGLKHPSLQSDGMFLDNTTMYQKIPPYLSYAETDAGGETKIYTLQKSAYWPSGLAVASRTWKHWSDSTEAETGDNQKYTFTASKIGHVTAAGTAWSGANPSAIALETVPNSFLDYASSIFSYSDAALTTEAAKYTVGDRAYFSLLVKPTNTLGSMTASSEILDSAYATVQALSSKTASWVGGSVLDTLDMLGVAKDEWDTAGVTPGVYVYHFKIVSGATTVLEQWKSFEVVAVEESPIRFDGGTF